MSLIYAPTKRKRAADDPFFQEGDIALRAYWLQKEAHSSDDVAMIRAEAFALASECSKPIYCEFPSCQRAGRNTLEFFSITAYESHYETMHRHVCIECQKIFPSAHFLHLHIDELHNVFKQIQKERGEKIHACYVVGCAKRFSEPKMRRLHLVDKHHYSRSFPFDIIVTGTLSFETRRRRMLARRHAKPPSTPPPPVTAMDIDDLTSHMTRLKIPTTISFGRQAKPALYHHRGTLQLAAEPSVPPQSSAIASGDRRPRRKRGLKKKKDEMQF